MYVQLVRKYEGQMINEKIAYEILKEKGNIYTVDENGNINIQSLNEIISRFMSNKMLYHVIENL